MDVGPIKASAGGRSAERGFVDECRRAGLGIYKGAAEVAGCLSVAQYRLWNNETTIGGRS